MKHINLQLFAAPDNMTGSSQFSSVSARDIDFVSSFSKNVQSLLDILGISRMIKKANGTQLVVKTASGTLQSGSVAEGDEIPMSQFGVAETTIGSITLEKYRKGVSAEAISNYGYDVAVARTDEELKSQLTGIVTNKFYDFMKTGTLKSQESSWKKAIAMAIGRVKHKFQTINRTATGIAVFVNTLDVYSYIGDADLTVQTAFGMDYIKGFMGADIVFLSDKINQGTVIATPLNNLMAYYVDPGDSEFSKAGLVYAVDSENGFVGYHSEGNYSRAISESFALMGITIMAEYLDAVAIISVDATPTLGALTLTSAAGTKVGDTKITVSPAKESTDNIYKYKVADAAVTVTYGQNVQSWTLWDGTSDITAATNKVITLVECDASYQAQKSGNATVTAKAE